MDGPFRHISNTYVAFLMRYFKHEFAILFFHKKKGFGFFCQIKKNVIQHYILAKFSCCSLTCLVDKLH